MDGRLRADTRRRGADRRHRDDRVGHRRVRVADQAVPPAGAPRGNVMIARPRSGMTLMELVISLAITGLVAAAAAGTFTSVIDSRTRAREVAHASSAAAATRGMLVA